MRSAPTQLEYLLTLMVLEIRRSYSTLDIFNSSGLASNFSLSLRLPGLLGDKETVQKLAQLFADIYCYFLSGIKPKWYWSVYSNINFSNDDLVRKQQNFINYIPFLSQQNCFLCALINLQRIIDFKNIVLLQLTNYIRSE